MHYTDGHEGCWKGSQLWIRRSQLVVVPVHCFRADWKRHLYWMDGHRIMQIATTQLEFVRLGGAMVLPFRTGCWRAHGLQMGCWGCRIYVWCAWQWDTRTWVGLIEFRMWLPNGFCIWMFCTVGNLLYYRLYYSDVYVRMGGVGVCCAPNIYVACGLLASMSWIVGW